MKAVKKFKNAIARRRPHRLDCILGRDTQFFQPPLSITNADRPPLNHKHRSMDTHDRQPTERALVVEGLHRDTDLQNYQAPIERRDDSAAGFTAKSPERSSTDKSEGQESASSPYEGRDLNADPGAHRAVSHAATFPQTIPHKGKGQAHDPLSDHLYLYLGPVASSRPPSPPTVSESPPAAGTDIYETAYRREVERIRASQGRSATLFLTRRVEQMEDFMKDQSLIKTDGSVNSKSITSLSKVISAARAKAEDDTAHEDRMLEKSDQEANGAQPVGGGIPNEQPQRSPEESKNSGLASFSKLVDQAKSIAGKGADINRSATT